MRDLPFTHPLGIILLHTALLGRAHSRSFAITLCFLHLLVGVHRKSNHLGRSLRTAFASFVFYHQASIKLSRCSAMYISILIRALPPFLVLWLLSSLADARIRSPAQQQRLASILAEKPMHTTALLAGAAASPMPAMPSVALKSRVMNRDSIATQDEGIDNEHVRKALAEYVTLSSLSVRYSR